MKTLSTIILLLILSLTLFLVQYHIQASTGSPAIEVIKWWWVHGKGHGAVIFFSMGFLAFILLMSNSLMMVGEIIVAKPVNYVWIGEGLYQGSDQYYDLNDPDKNQFEVKNATGDFDFNPTTSLSRLYQIQTLFKYGPNPEDAQFWTAYNIQSKFAQVILQYAGLLFGCLAVWQILKQYHEVEGGSMGSFSSPAIVLCILIGFHVLILLVGNVFLQKKIKLVDPVPKKEVTSATFEPGDTLHVRFAKKVKQRSESGNKPFSVHYLVEWRDDEGIKLSGVIGFKGTISLRSAIQTLDQATDTHTEVECVIRDDYKLIPLVLAGNRSLTIL